MRPRGDDLDDLMAQVQPVALGICDLALYPEWLLSAADIDEWKREIRERKASRRPIGFTAEWPADVPLRRVV